MTPRKPSSSRRAAHPTISDVALALASRPSSAQSRIGLERGMNEAVKVSVDVADADPVKAKDVAVALFVELCEQFPPKAKP